MELEVKSPKESDETLYVMEAYPTLLDKIKEAQCRDEECEKMRKKILDVKRNEFSIDGDGMIKFEKRIWVPVVPELKDEILQEAHRSSYAIHPGSTKMYQDLRQYYWWPNTKRDVAECVSRCLTCQRVKVEHQKPSGLLQPLEIPE